MLTWSKSERAIRYREDPTGFRTMAEIETCSGIRDVLMRLSEEYYWIADQLSRLTSEASV